MRSVRRYLFASGLVLACALTLSVSGQFPIAGKLNIWTVRPVSRQHRTSSTVRAVRVVKQAGFDRVVFEFDGPVPNYSVQYLKSDYYEGEDGRHKIRMAGSRFMQVELNQISSDDKQMQFIEAKGFIPKGKLNLPAVMQVDDRALFEGFYDFLIGVNGRKPFRVTEFSDPSRLVIDFKH